MRRTKIICTIGPASDSKEVMESLILNGMDVARINTSHSNEEDVVKKVNLIRDISTKHGKNTAIMLDLQGPKIRIGNLKEEILLEDNQLISFIDKSFNESIVDKNKSLLESEIKKLLENDSFKEIKEKDFLKSNEIIFEKLLKIKVEYDNFLNDIKEGFSIFIDDGLLECRILKIDRKFNIAFAIVVKGGILKSNKGINLPGISVSIDSVTQKDLFFLNLGIKLKVDFIAQSFVRAAQDIKIVKDIIANNNSKIMVISKIEKHEAIKNFDSILKITDGVMVARGDLGIELPQEVVPIIQKDIIKRTNLVGKPVITATQMLDSMIRNPRPTRAEVSDVSNAIFDGSDALMLSGETAMGAFPVEALKMMVKIIEKTEENIDYKEILQKKFLLKNRTTTEAISFAACEIASELNLKAIITATQSGSTARQVSKNRPKSIIIGTSPDETVVRQLMISWGVIPELTKFKENVNEMICEIVKTSKKIKLIKKGDKVIITGGILVSKPGSTNFLHVKEID